MPLGNAQYANQVSSITLKTDANYKFKIFRSNPGQIRQKKVYIREPSVVYTVDSRYLDFGYLE